MFAKLEASVGVAPHVARELVAPRFAHLVDDGRELLLRGEIIRIASHVDELVDPSAQLRRAVFGHGDPANA